MADNNAKSRQPQLRGKKGHGPGGPGAKMMPGEKAKDFKGMAPERISPVIFT